MTPENKADTFEGTDWFVIRRRLGAGSFGTVYEVLIDSAGRVALKACGRPTRWRSTASRRSFAPWPTSFTETSWSLRADGRGRPVVFTIELVDGVHFSLGPRVEIAPVAAAQEWNAAEERRRSRRPMRPCPRRCPTGRLAATRAACASPSFSWPKGSRPSTGG